MKKIPVMMLCLAGALMIGRVVFAQDNAATSDLEAKTRELEEAIYNGTDDIDLMYHRNELFVDVPREIKRMKNELRQQQKIAAMNSELEARLVELRKLQQELSKVITKRAGENGNIKLLVTLYESISVDSAADLLKRLPATVAVTMMQMMSPRKSSKILGAMDPSAAAKLSRMLLTAPSLSSVGGA